MFDGQIDIDNNQVENATRHIVIGFSLLVKLGLKQMRSA
ncbi:hypothetical protein [Solibacillus daqui]|nr:hypothetical protein [Solibacillus daqui]